MKDLNIVSLNVIGLRSKKGTTFIGGNETVNFQYVFCKKHIAQKVLMVL